MKRKEFIKTCSTACLGFSAFGGLMQSCTGYKLVTSAIEGENMVVPLSEFEITRRGKRSYHSYIIAQNEILRYPICIYRFSAANYSALWLRCTHQGTELQVFGDKLECPAHGSEFGTSGKVTNGPASEDLRTFPVSIADNQLNISLA